MADEEADGSLQSTRHRGTRHHQAVVASKSFLPGWEREVIMVVATHCVLVDYKKMVPPLIRSREQEDVA